MMVKRYAVAGASSRGLYMYAKPIHEEYSDVAKVVGVFDINPHRARVMSAAAGGAPVYSDFDQMMEELRPDCVIVTTVDRYHHEYAVRAMEMGADAIIEKPMAIKEEYCQAIIDAQKRTGKKAIITFNMRYMPYVAAIKKCIMDGAVGKVLSVNMEWMLDTSHGADYFRRWHRYLDKSGGLLIHKASHHFDAVNWWIGQDPVSVQATASRTFYGPTRSERSERCLTCPYKERCSFYFDITKNPIYKELYLDAEGYDGYFRDRCVFDASIDIYDNMALNVRYDGGAVMSYLLIAHSPYEGWKCSITGTDGRLEACDIMSGPDASEAYQILLYDREGAKRVLDVEKIDEVHGGGDARIRGMLFLPGQSDPLGQQAGTHAGAMSALIGAAANRSIREGNRIDINIRE